MKLNCGDWIEPKSPVQDHDPLHLTYSPGQTDGPDNERELDQMMNSGRWGTLPARIFNARAEGKALDLGDAADAPRDIEDAYNLQDALSRAWGEPVVGWKIGATAPAVQARFGTDRPFSAPFYRSNTFHSPSKITRSKLQHKKIESEFAFRFMRDLDPKNRNYGRDEIIDAIDALVPAIEIVSPRFVDIPFGNAPLAIADWGVNGAVVLGTPVVQGWDPDQVRSSSVRLAVDGRPVAEGEGSVVLGDPINALIWLVQHLGSRGIAISAGTIVLTGTTTGIFDMETHGRAVADFGEYGTVEVEFD